MSDSKIHYVAYHNTEGMGQILSASNSFRVFTNKPVGSLHENVVWMIVGEGKAPRQFSLGSVFRVTETGDTTEKGFKHFASGNGHFFEPSIPLNDVLWFDDFKKAMNRFQFGVQRINSESHVAALKSLATRAGATVP